MQMRSARPRRTSSLWFSRNHYDLAGQIEPGERDLGTRTTRQRRESARREVVEMLAHRHEAERRQYAGLDSEAGVEDTHCEKDPALLGCAPQQHIPARPGSRGTFPDLVRHFDVNRSTGS